MQKPLNTAERSSAFWKFLFFFFIAVFMIVTAVYFNFRVPFKENALLKEKAENMRLQSMAQEKFTNSILEAKALIDSMGKPGVNVKFISNQVSDKLSELTNLHIADNSIQGSLDKVIIGVVFDYNKLKSDMTNFGDSQSQIAELTSKNEQLMRDNDQLRRDLNLYQRGIGR
jgi:Type VI secretion system, TssO